MRRARSQLNRLTQQQSGNFGDQNGHQNPYANASINEVDEIQRRLDALQFQQPDMDPNQGHPNHAVPNNGFPNPAQSSGFHQPMPNQFANPNAAIASTPHYAAPQSQPAANPQLDTIKSALEQMSSKLQAINSANATNSNQQNAGLQQSELLKQHYNHINAELQGLKASIEGIASASTPNNNLEIIQETLSANYRAIMQQLEGSQNNQLDHSVFSSALDASHKELSKQIIDIKQSIDTSLNNPNLYAKTLEVSHDDITKRLDDMHNALQTAIATPDIYVSEIQNNHNEVLQQVSQLQQVIENLERNTPEPSQTDLSSVEMRLEEITRAVVALSLDDGSLNNLERIEARVSDIAKTLDANNTSNVAPQPIFDNSGFDRLESKLVDLANLMNTGSPDLDAMGNQINLLSEKLENFTSVSASTPLSNDENNALLNRMDDLVEQIGNTNAANSDISNDEIAHQLSQISGAIDKLSTPSPVNTDNNKIANDVVMEQLQQIAGAIDQLAKPSADNMSANQFASIEQQLSEISNQLHAAPSEFSSENMEVSFDPITSRLTGIEEQLGANRDITIEMATKAAQDAVQMSFNAMPQMAGASGQLDTSALEPMSELLAQLNQHIETNNSSSIEAFGAMTQTLDLMVQRLGKIETNLSDNASVAQVAPLPIQTQPQALQEATIETEVPVEKPAKVGAQDLVKAARASAKQDRLKPEPASGISMELIANEALLQDTMSEVAQDHTPIGDIQKAVEQVSYEDRPVLPEVQTPNMAMDALPEVKTLQEDKSDPDIALEPGSGGPDLASLVRQANERRKNNKHTDSDSSGTDFIAAARRAAQAAAQEAGAVEEEIEEKTKKSLFASLPELFAKRKKAIIMAGAAALFVTLAIPLASQFFGEKDKEVASLGNSIFIEETENQEALQASTLPAENTVRSVTPIDSVEDAQSQPTTDTNSKAIDTQVEATSSDQQELPQQINLASVNINENPKPATFISSEGLDFASAELRQAVQKGEPAALFEVGRLYTNGLGTEKDLLKASQWYERAANMGFAPAQYIIGNFNEKGLGIEKNAQVAAQWYEKAAKGGNIIAMHNLAVLTATPNALSADPDMAEAFKWFSNAADYGVRDSQVNAGIFHTKGFGTEVNLVEAYKWFSIAAKAGDKDAANKRDVITNAIQPDQLEIAKALVKDWKPLETVKAANEVTANDAWKVPQAVANSSLKIDRNVIAQTQTLLNKVGFNAGVADGLMGQKTRNAIAAFQQKTGLPVNGKIDGEFLKSLKAVAI